ncbi:MAG: CRISPR-associated endonuclease Cas2 [Bacilli bacterium]
MKKLNKSLPNKGNIIILKLTDKQYNEMIYLNGEKTSMIAL